VALSHRSHARPTVVPCGPPACPPVDVSGLPTIALPVVVGPALTYGRSCADADPASPRPAIVPIATALINLLRTSPPSPSVPVADIVPRIAPVALRFAA
jgi:hypothetical protein